MPLQRSADLLQAADKYGLVGCLKPLLEEHICGMVDASNVARVLAMADLHGAELIKKYIVRCERKHMLIIAPLLDTANF